jgi:DNA repair exonuclease SbcCD ATPase subunit
MSQRKTIRFEDLGEPVQRLLKSIKGGVTDEDMALLEYVSVKDMAKIYQEMSSARQAAEIWEELRNALQARRDKAERKIKEIERRQKEIDDQAEQEAAQRAAEEAERLQAEQEAEERRKRKEERRRRRQEEAAAAAAAEEEAAVAEQEAREEEERLAAEEAERKRREAKRKKREARARELQEEQDALAAEREKQAKKKISQKQEWSDYVASHPLEFNQNVAQTIDQVKLEHETKAPPKITEELLKRTYTPKCPNCAAKFSKPPPEWDCPLCLRRLRQRIKVWQPDNDTDNCMCCEGSIGRFSRHHCRNCGRLVCAKCSEGRAIIAQLGFKDPVKVCKDCVNAAVQKREDSPPS